jgi:hypothetical protein
MNAPDLLKRYAASERDFTSADTTEMDIPFAELSNVKGLVAPKEKKSLRPWIRSERMRIPPEIS